MAELLIAKYFKGNVQSKEGRTTTTDKTGFV